MTPEPGVPSSGPVTPAGPEPRRPIVPMRWVVILTVVITGFAAAVAIWMYWLANLVA